MRSKALTPMLDPTLGPAVTPMAFIRAMVLAYARYGKDPSQALARAQIAPQQLADPHARVTALQMELMSGEAMQELDDEALGWFSRRLPWGTYGMLCRASLTAPNLEVAIKRWCRHHRLLTEDVLLQPSLHDGVLQVRLVEQRDLGAMREFCLVTSLRYLHGYACWLIDSRIPLIEARFPFAAPDHQDAYPKMFRGPVVFDADQAGYSFDARYLTMAPRRDEAALQAMLQRALPLTVLQYRRDRLLVQRVRQLLSTDAADLHNADQVAERLHVSTRTLHRQLQEEGATLQALKDEARRERAVQLLQRTDKPIKQVAMAAGFAHEKSFSRAFKSWTGQSPGEFRSQRR